MKIKKIRHARPFFVQGNRDFSSGRPHKKLLTITSIEIFKKSAKRDHFSLKKIAIFHHIAPIKNLLTITSIENFQKIRQARPFFLRGNRDFSSGRPHQNFINHNFVRAQRAKFCTPPNAVFLFENRYFLTHRPPDKIKVGRAQRGKFLNTSLILHEFS